jgi:hypothetical protein
MPKADWLRGASPAFRLAIATSWLAPESFRARQQAAISAALDAGPDWPEYLRLLDRHGIPGLGWAALRDAAQGPVPLHIEQELKRQSDDCRKLAVVYCMVLADVLKRFNAAAIPAMPMKGQILSFDLYNDVGLRYSRDLDVEVRAGDLEKAHSCLVGPDWQLESSFFPMSPRQWQSFLGNEQHINFIHVASGCMLELHWRSQWETSEATRARWERSVPAVWQKHAIQTMHPGDLALYLCCHGGLHQWFRAKWLGDLARAHTMGLLDWPASFAAARMTGEERTLLAGLALLREVYGIPLPDLAQEIGAGCSPLLVEAPLRALMDPGEPIAEVGLEKFRNRIRRSRYERLLWPRKSRWSSVADLFYSREDFRTIALPDTLFWAYIPLRPVLWLWRWLRRLLPRATHKESGAS